MNRAGFIFWGAHAPRVLVAAPRRNSLLDCRSYRKKKFAMARAPSPAREGACAPQTSEAATTFTRRLPARFEYLLLLEAADCIWRKPG